MSVTQLGYIDLTVRDLDAWERFATQFLGFQVSDRADDGRLYLRMDERHHRFTVIPGNADGIARVGWEVANAQALREAVARLTAAKIPVTPGTEAEARARRVRDLVKFPDPAGLNGELYYGALVDERPFRPGRAMSGFVTGTGGLGHVLVDVEKPEEIAAFYCNLLGFRVTDYILWDEMKVNVLFLHCNPRHHSLGLVYGPNASPGRINHFMLEVRSLDDVGHAYDLADKLGLTVVQALGKHTNDHMISFYVTNPSGFGVEYGWGGLTITDEASWVVQHHVAASQWGHKRRLDAAHL